MAHSDERLAEKSLDAGVDIDKVDNDQEACASRAGRSNDSRGPGRRPIHSVDEEENQNVHLDPSSAEGILQRQSFRKFVYRLEYGSKDWHSQRSSV